MDDCIYHLVCPCCALSQVLSIQTNIFRIEHLGVIEDVVLGFADFKIWKGLGFNLSNV